MAIAGNWKITVKTPMGDQQSTLTLAVGDDTLTGTQGGAFGASELTGGVVNGNAATWKTKITKPFPMDLEFFATFDGDSVSGKVKAGMLGESTFTGSRA